MNLHQIFNWVPVLAGVIALAIGLFAVVLPQKASKSFGIEVSGQALHFVVATGARDIFIGLITLVVYWYGDMKIIGATFLCIAVVAFFDFILTMKYGSRRHSVIHAAGAIVSLVYGMIVI